MFNSSKNKKTAYQAGVTPFCWVNCHTPSTLACAAAAAAAYTRASGRLGKLVPKRLRWWEVGGQGPNGNDLRRGRGFLGTTLKGFFDSTAISLLLIFCFFGVKNCQWQVDFSFQFQILWQYNQNLMVNVTVPGEMYLCRTWVNDFESLNSTPALFRT